jgi:FMN phosphatase YigB (HAD superfamily)
MNLLVLNGKSPEEIVHQIDMFEKEIASAKTVSFSACWLSPVESPTGGV